MDITFGHDDSVTEPENSEKENDELAGYIIISCKCYHMLTWFFIFAGSQPKKKKSSTTCEKSAMPKKKDQDSDERKLV